MQSQVDFLPVGDKKCGEAIAIRFGDLASGDPTKQTVVLIDAGFTGDTQMVVDHLQGHFNASAVDLAVSSHADNDHIGGMPGVVSMMPVRRLWMHLPWEHSDDILASRQEDFFTGLLTKKLQKSLQGASDLAAAADAARITPEEPFAGKQFISPYGRLTVLGPTRQYYEELLGQILEASTKKQHMSQPSLLTTLTTITQKLAQAAAGALESHSIETLTDSGTTSPSNNTSTVLLLELADGSEKLLFCGDAGMPALELAYMSYEALGHEPGQLNLVQVPHHGSRHNVGPTILDKFLGTRASSPDMLRGQACVSVGKTCEGDGHPKKVVMNAFNRRGYPVTQTRGRGIMYGFDRPGWGSIAPLPLYESVESDD